GILRSSFKKIERGRPRKYYDMSHDITVNIIINQNTFQVDITDEALSRKQLPSGDEWSRLLNVEHRIRMGQWEAVEELKSLIQLYETLKKRAEDVLEDVEGPKNE
ncbi:MAG: transcriptional regulator, partial [Methanobacteriaceae archaeon]|nr:transcriptional regulator [Methanobacteriaceae archaeon]